MSKTSKTRLTAYWVDDSYCRKCTNCGSSTCWTDDEGLDIPSKYCPECGAKIKGYIDNMK